MSVSYVDRGRSNQKRRTRSAIVEAAVELARASRTPTVAEAAAIAGVSRATAYRYFSTQESLLSEVTAEKARALDERLEETAADEPAARLTAAIERFIAFMVEHDTELRTMLRLSLERERADDPDLDVPVREGRRAAYFETALAPLADRLPPAERTRLNAALGMVVGTEALVVLQDIYDLDVEEAQRIMHWAAETLVRAALKEDAA